MNFNLIVVFFLHRLKYVVSLFSVSHIFCWKVCYILIFDGWMASLTRWIWVWVNSWCWWWTGRPGVLWFMGSQRVRYDWATDLIWSDFYLNMYFLSLWLLLQFSFPHQFFTSHTHAHSVGYVPVYVHSYIYFSWYSSVLLDLLMPNFYKFLKFLLLLPQIFLCSSPLFRSATACI